jgi:hypothetical protein
MSEQPTQKVTFTLRGDGITVTYSPSDGTMDGTLDKTFGDVSLRQIPVGAYRIDTTRDEFGILATVPIGYTRNWRVDYLTLAVPNVLPHSDGDGNAPGGADPSSKANVVKAIAIISSRWDEPGRPAVSSGWTVTALNGTVAVTG